MSETETRDDELIRNAELAKWIDRAKKAERAAKTLTKVVEDQCRDIVRITKSEGLVREDGDADWGAIWGRGFRMAARLHRTEDELRSTEAVLAYTKETARLAVEANHRAEDELARLRGVVEAVQALHHEVQVPWGAAHTIGKPTQYTFAKACSCTRNPELRCQTLAALAPVSSSGEAESGECTCQRYVVDYSDPDRYHPENVDREDDPACPVHAPAPVSSGGQADGEGEGPATVALRLSEAATRLSTHGGVSFAEALDALMAAAGYVPAARPVLSREALREAVLAGLRTAWRDDHSAASVADAITDHLADVLAGGQR